MLADRCPLLPDMKIARAEQPKQADNNQIYGDDVIQQTRHNQNENAGDQRNQRGRLNVILMVISLVMRGLGVVP